MENSPSKARIYVILAVYFLFWHVQSVQRRYRAAWQRGQQRSERALNHKKTTKSQKREFSPSLRPSKIWEDLAKQPIPNYTPIYCRKGCVGGSQLVADLPWPHFLAQHHFSCSPSLVREN